MKEWFIVVAMIFATAVNFYASIKLGQANNKLIDIFCTEAK